MSSHNSTWSDQARTKSWEQPAVPQPKKIFLILLCWRIRETNDLIQIQGFGCYHVDNFRDKTMYIENNFLIERTNPRTEYSAFKKQCCPLGVVIRILEGELAQVWNIHEVLGYCTMGVLGLLIWYVSLASTYAVKGWS